MVEVGHVLAGRYELVEHLGRGGMATVFRGRDRELRRDVAVKVLDPSFFSEEDLVQRFQREGRLTASIDHPNVVAVYDSGRDGEAHYLVMELVEGRSLQQVLADVGRLQAGEAVRIGQQIAFALEAAHDKELVHRDVKPGNVILTADGTAKITDFGIAGLGETSPVGASDLFGTVHYIAPEQARGDDVDARTDIYAAGCLLYEMVAGRAPFVADRAAAVIYQHLEREPEPPSAHAPGVPPEFDEVVLRALRKDPADRYPSARELRDALTGLGLRGADETVAVPAVTQVIGQGMPDGGAETQALPPVGAGRPATTPADRDIGWRNVSLAVAAVVIVGVILLWLLLAGRVGGSEGSPLPVLTAEPETRTGAVP